MKYLRRVWFYTLIFFILSGSFLYLYNKKIGNNEKEVSQVVHELGIAKDDGTFQRMQSIHGQVIRWQYQSGVLQIKTDQDEIKSFQIDPSTSKVFVPKARRSDNDNQLFILKINSGLHWQTAFCLGDEASLLVDNSDKVNVVINAGKRMCGYQAPIE